VIKRGARWVDGPRGEGKLSLANAIDLMTAEDPALEHGNHGNFEGRIHFRMADEYKVENVALSYGELARHFLTGKEIDLHEICSTAVS
jgi:hypothetical protein